jgi:hypothetical protein
MGISRDLLRKIVDQFGLDIHGIHGTAHWIRVYENGYRLAQSTGANVNVLMCGEASW